jgi:hypothetical protein
MKMPRDYDVEKDYLDARADYLDDLRDEAAEAESDALQDEFLDYCKENDEDPNSLDSWDAFKDNREYRADPYKYYGVSRSDFL